MVEAIMVAAVVAVLAITATMIYRGYITDTRQQTVANLAETAAAAANACVRRTGVNLATGDSAKLQLFFTNPADYEVTITPNSSDLHGTITIRNVPHDVTAAAGY